MSLHHLARQVQSQGRGDDKMLVHMTPGEVQGLQGLAMKHGGSLTINPETGLPEAGFLKNILPTVIGAGAMMIPGMQPIGAAMIGGGLGLAMSGGNLKQGILGGLGAWGGASLVGGMMGAGSAAAAGLVPEGAAIAGAEAAGTLGNQFAYNSAGEMVASNYAPSITGAAEGTRILGTPTASASIQEGFKQAAANPGQFFKQNMFPIGAAAAPVLFGGSDQQSGIGAPPDQGQIRPYTYSQTRNPNFGKVPGEAYFDQSYTAGTPYAAANGGLVALAEGGITQPIVPMQQLAAPVTTYGAQRPVSQAVTDYNQLIAQRANNEYNVQPAPLSTLPGRGQFANAADLGKIINRYYLQDLGRAAEPEGLAAWTGAVQNKGMSLADVSKNIKGSQEGLARQKMQEQAALEANPQYQSYISAPITRENFDAADYVNRYPDAGDRSIWTSGDIYGHYLEANRLGDVRTANRLPFQSGQSGQTGQSGYTYDAATQRFTAPTAPSFTDAGGFMGGIASDPNFQAYLQNQYNQYQQAQQYGGGGAAGGLMPGALKYNMGGGISDLGGYSDGGRLLKGPGDGVSDSIPARIGAKQPARLADGEFVVPARIVSELGNGSTDAGARRLYAMMDRVQKKRGKTVGKNKVAVNSKAESALPV